MVKCVTMIDKEGHQLYFDYIEIDDNPSVICHLDIKKWNKTTKKEILKDIYDTLSAEPLPKYVVWDGKDIKFFKFISMAGFLSTGYHTKDYGNEDEYLFKWCRG